MQVRKMNLEPINTKLPEPYVKINLCQEDSLETETKENDNHHKAASTERRDSMVIFDSQES